MSRSYRRATAKKLQEIINTSTDPMIIIEASNALAKYLPKPKQPRRRRGTTVPTPIKPKELSLDELVAAAEKQRKRQGLSAGEQAAVNGGSANGA